MCKTNMFQASNPDGYKAEIRQADDGFSLFIWRDNGSGVHLWRESHGLTWPDAFSAAINWLSIVPADSHSRLIAKGGRE